MQLVTIVPMYMTMLMMATHMKTILGRFMFICVGVTFAEMSCSFLHIRKFTNLVSSHAMPPTFVIGLLPHFLSLKFVTSQSLVQDLNFGYVKFFTYVGFLPTCTDFFLIYCVGILSARVGSLLGPPPLAGLKEKNNLSQISEIFQHFLN